MMSQVRSDFLGGCGPKGRDHTRLGANGVHQHMRLIYNWAVAVGKLKEVPWKLTALKVFRKPKLVLDADKVDAFLDGVKRARNPHVLVAVMSQLYLGLRESEALHMRWEHFGEGLRTLVPGKWSSEGGFKSKGGEAVALPVPEAMREAILALLPAGTEIPSQGWVLPAEDGLPHRPKFQRRAITRGGKAAGVPGLTSHRLRGTCATLMARAGVDIFVIQAFLRHESIKTTEQYVEVHSGDLKAAQETLMGRITGRITPLKTPRKTTA